MMLLFLCTFLSLTVLSCQGATAILEPLSYVALLNQTSKPTFSCTVHGANYASWEINGQPDLVDREIERQGRGIETEHDRIVGMSRSYHATLKLSPSMVNQYTEIKCWAAVRDGSGPSVASETAIFQVQGLLGEPQNVTSLPLNMTHTTIQWQPPYTLNITDIEPDILQYTVCVSITDISQYCFNGTTLGIVLPSLNVRKEVSVSAWNGLGSGETAELSVDACEPQNNTGTEAVVEMEEFGEINLVVIFNFSSVDLTQTICFCLYNLTLAHNNNITTHVGPLIPSVFHSESYSIVVSAGILPNEQYKAELTCVSGDSEISPNTTILFNSFDVQDVTLEISEENLTLLLCCVFALGSQAQGCHIHITTNHTQQQQQHITRNVTQHGATSCWEESDIDRGVVYMISVYDWERDGSVDLTKPVYSADVFVNPSDEDHNTDRSASTPITETKTEPKMEALNVHTTALSQVAVDKGTTHTSTLYIIAACSSAAVVLFIITVLLAVFCCVWVKRKRRSNVNRKIAVVNSHCEFIHGISCRKTLEVEDGMHCSERHQKDSFSHTHCNNRDIVLTTNTTTFGERSTNTPNTCVPTSNGGYHTKHHSNDSTKALTLCQCMHDTGNSLENTSPVIHCPVYDHSEIPVYDQIAQPWPSSTNPGGSSSITIHNGSYSSVANVVALETNVAYGCAQKQRRTCVATRGRRFKVNRGPLPSLPMETNSTSHRGRKCKNQPAGAYETVVDL